MKKMLITILILILAVSGLQGQAIPQERSIYQNRTLNLDNDAPSGQKYITGSDGVIRMYVNIWGHVNKPGTHLVYDGIDFVTLLSISGGPKEGARLGEIKLIRAEPDESGKRIYELDFNEFVNSGKKENFVDIRPNDTVVIGEKTSHMLLSNLSVINTALHLFQIYFQAEYYRTR
ncbi:MAG: SLBB domain-containing protein [Fidelibacterota bacterium]